MMRLIESERQLNRFMSLLKKRAEGIDEDVLKSVRKILDDVRERGDRALREYTERFDGLRLRNLRLSQEEIRRAAEKTPPEIRKALRISAARIRRFHQKQMERSWSYREDGALLGQIIQPLERVGVYVPGGKASYPSTVLMNVIPAQVAGVDEIALTLPTPGGEVNPAVMAAIELIGVKEVYTVGGAQAIGALAYGTKTIRPVDKIVGPGNIYVATAKRMVFGLVDIDMIAGPSEILVIADFDADPVLVAADLLSQAEHDELASSILITTSRRLARKVQDEVKRQLQMLSRREIAERSLKNFGRVILTKSLEEAVEIANRIAPEHLEIMTGNPRGLLKGIRNAGAIFLGPWTPEPIGDYSAGPNHTLPTGGTARFSSPLGVYDFLKRSSLLMFEKKGFMMLADTVQTLAEAEGLEAHAKTVSLRLERADPD